MNSQKISDNSKNNYFSIRQTEIFNASDSDIKIESELKDNELSLYVISEKACQTDKISVEIDYDFKEGDKVYVNGYQSWTDSKEYSLCEKMFAPAPLMQAVLRGPIGKSTGIANAGDTPILNFKREKGKFYGFSYGYVRRGDKVDVFGSLSERNGYTIIEFDSTKNRIVISVDLKGKKIIAGKNLLLHVGRFMGEYNNAFDEYFKAMDITPKQKPLLTGYTTWYNYYRNITQKIVERDLQAISKLDAKVDIFQIDDGYQLAIGDWLNCVQSKFPDGMKAMSKLIHEKNMLAGLWLAPFAVTKDCFIFKEHNDWIVRDEKGKLVKAGANWGGFYSLDIYNPNVREYIRKFFDVILNDWGYDLVKLDFLYCACIVPMYGKSRGEIMCDAMDLLRDCCGKKLILGCGVPLAPAFGKVDYCRIGPDVSLDWGKRKYDSREGVSTKHAILNSVFRRHLDGRAFGNDPDVFLLRDTNIRLNAQQKKSLAKINKLCGKVLFTSDNIDDYNDDKTNTIKYIFDRNIPKIFKAEYDDGVLTIEYEENSKKDTFTIRL